MLNDQGNKKSILFILVLQAFLSQWSTDRIAACYLQARKREEARQKGWWCGRRCKHFIRLLCFPQAGAGGLQEVGTPHPLPRELRCWTHPEFWVEQLNPMVWCTSTGIVPSELPKCVTYFEAEVPAWKVTLLKTFSSWTCVSACFDTESYKGWADLFKLQCVYLYLHS